MKRKAKAIGTGRRREAPAAVPRVIISTKLMRELVEWPTDSVDQFSTRARLENYLAGRKVLVARPGDVPVSIRRAKLMSEADCTAAIEKAQQEFVDTLLRRVLAGEDPRRVFRLEAKRRGVKSAAARELAAVHEFARLRAAGVANAAELVAPAYAASTRTLDRWCRRWDVDQVNVAEYQAQLRSLGLL